MLKQIFSKRVPDKLYAFAAVPYWLLHPHRKGVLLVPCSGFWLAVGKGVRFFTPDPRRVQSPFCGLPYEYYFGVNNGDVVLDVGACIGEFTLSIADRAGKIVAIEPEPRNLAFLHKNVESLPNVQVVGKAAWHCKDKLKLHLSRTVASHSLFLSVIKKSKRTMKSVEVQADTLDNITTDLGIGKVDFIKINVEGAELETLKGAKKVLKTAKKVVVEAIHKREEKKTSPRVSNFLKARGFMVHVGPKDFVYAWRDDAKKRKISD